MIAIIQKDKKAKLEGTLGLALQLESKERVKFDLGREKKTLEEVIPNLPDKIQNFKLVSTRGGFSSISLISYIASKEIIEELWVTTFRVGNRQFEELKNLYNSGRIKKIHLITSSSQESIDSKAEYKGEKYNYLDYIKQIQEDKNWKVTTSRNHSKIILLKTEENNYVVETSSNLNENPQMEQFNLENDAELLNWYKQIFQDIEKVGENYVREGK